MTWTPNFFYEVPHPYLKKDTFKSKEFVNATYWKPIETGNGKKSYWDRREEKDWAGMPKLWGPFD